MSGILDRSWRPSRFLARRPSTSTARAEPLAASSTSAGAAPARTVRRRFSGSLQSSYRVVAASRRSRAPPRQRSLDSAGTAEGCAPMVHLLTPTVARLVSAVAAWAAAAPPADTAAQSASTAPSATRPTRASSPSRLRYRSALAAASSPAAACWSSTATAPDSSTSLRPAGPDLASLSIPKTEEDDGGATPCSWQSPARTLSADTAAGETETAAMRRRSAWLGMSVGSGGRGRLVTGQVRWPPSSQRWMLRRSKVWPEGRMTGSVMTSSEMGQRKSSGQDAWLDTSMAWAESRREVGRNGKRVGLWKKKKKKKRRRRRRWWWWWSESVLGKVHFRWTGTG
ncbi:hypothetical protein VPH35_123564 [Triticum aestivum]